MKKHFLHFSILISLIICATSMWAGEISITFSELGLENGVSYPDPFVLDENISITFSEGNVVAKYYDVGAAMRVYANGKMTISADSGSIKKIQLISLR